MSATAPGKRPFYKYASPETVQAILSGQSVRYSSPLAFNDPFDVQSGLHFDFDISSFPERIIGRLAEVAAAPEAPPVDPEDVWGQLVLKLRELYPKYGFSKERWTAETTGLFSWLADKIKETQQGYQEHWRKILPTVRVFCVSEERDNLLMWAHYARDHKGAVLELWSLPEEDNPLSVAQPVQYGSRPPSFFSEQEFLDDLLSVRKLDFKALYLRYAYCKSDHWCYEKEWRIWYPMAKSGLYDTVPLRASEFKALYLGCQMQAEVRNEVIKLSREAYPSTRIFVASKDEPTYSLSFAEV